MPTRAELDQGFDIGDWEVLPLRGVLRRGEDEVRPEPKVFEVLIALAKREGNLVTKDELIEEVWEGKAFSDEPIQRCIALLRGHFGDVKPFSYIETLPRRGYRLMQNVRLHTPAEAEAPVVAEESNGPATVPGPSLLRWKVVAVIMTIGFLLTVFWRPVPDASDSLAILPIENLSGDPANAYLVDGIKNTLAHRLSELPGFTIKNARVRYDGEPSEVAAALGVSNVLFGALHMQGDQLKVTYEIARGTDNVMVAAGEIDGNLRHFFALQERFAEAVRSKLAGASAPELLKRKAPPDSEAYDSYMRGLYALEHRGSEQNLESAIDLFNESIRLDDGFGPAYLALATAYALLPDYRHADIEGSHRLAIETIERGVERDASIEAPAGAIYGFVYHQQKRWLESEAAHRRAVEAKVVDSNAFNWYSRMLASVGRLEDSLQMVLDAGKIDPDSAVVNNRIAVAYSWVGETDKAMAYFRRANELGADGPTHLWSYALFLARIGDLAQAKQVIEASVGGTVVASEWIDTVFAALGDPSDSNRAAAVAALDAADAEGILAPALSVAARTMMGDLDGAMGVAELLMLPGEIFEMDLLFIPDMKALRGHPGFMSLLERLGIVAYWDAAGCRWNGDVVDC